MNGEADVIKQLRCHSAGGLEGDIAGGGWKRHDRCHFPQIAKLPETATHLVKVSAGGNDGLSRAEILHKPTASVGTAVNELADLRAEFQRNYANMLEALLACRKPLAVCTIYDPRFPEPMTQRLTITALNIFNDCILREAILRGLPVLDLRLICDRPEDYANEIEPGIPGGKKIAAGILNLVSTHDFSGHRTSIYV